MRKFLLVAICCFVLGGCATYTEPQTTLSLTEEPEATSTPRPTKTPTSAPTATPEPTPTPTAEQKKQIEDSFKDTCRDYTEDTYERLMREDIQSGTRLCLEVKVVQDMGGITTDYYRTNGTIDSWDEEYIVYDYREESKPKIIEGDIIKIYGEFLWLGEFERSLTGTTVEIPIVYAKYIEFSDLEKPTTTPKPTATTKPKATSKPKATATPKPTSTPKPTATPKPTPTPTPSVSLGKRNALKEAKSYIEYSSFSYERLISQLEYEGYTYEEAVYGADNCNADWFEQALLEAISYLDYSSFSKEGLKRQLLYEKYTEEQAEYAINNCNANWFEQAVKEAESYLEYSSFSRKGLFDQLIYEGYTEEQTEHALSVVGY